MIPDSSSSLCYLCTREVLTSFGFSSYSLAGIHLPYLVYLVMLEGEAGDYPGQAELMVIFPITRAAAFALMLGGTAGWVSLPWKTTVWVLLSGVTSDQVS